MTRISYKKDNIKDYIEYSNLMVTTNGDMLFIEFNTDEFKAYIKDIDEGKIVETVEFKSIDEGRKKVRSRIIDLGVMINDEIRDKED